MIQSPLAVAVQGIGFGPLAIATHGLRGVTLGVRRGGSSGRDDTGAELAHQRAHRQALIRQQNDLILAIAVAVAGSGALD